MAETSTSKNGAKEGQVIGPEGRDSSRADKGAETGAVDGLGKEEPLEEAAPGQGEIADSTADADTEKIPPDELAGLIAKLDAEPEADEPALVDTSMKKKSKERRDRLSRRAMATIGVVAAGAVFGVGALVGPAVRSGMEDERGDNTAADSGESNNGLPDQEGGVSDEEQQEWPQAWDAEEDIVNGQELNELANTEEVERDINEYINDFLGMKASIAEAQSEEDPESEEDGSDNEVWFTEGGSLVLENDQGVFVPGNFVAYGIRSIENEDPDGDVRYRFHRTFDVDRDFREFLLLYPDQSGEWQGLIASETSVRYSTDNSRAIGAYHWIRPEPYVQQGFIDEGSLGPESDPESFLILRPDGLSGSHIETSPETFPDRESMVAQKKGELGWNAMPIKDFLQELVGGNVQQ